MAAGEGVLTVGVAGLGAIGVAVSRSLTSEIPGLRLAAVADRDPAKARACLNRTQLSAKAVALAELPEHVDVVVEALPASVFEEIAIPTIRLGRTFVPATVGALLLRPDLFNLASIHHARIVIPTGAIAGLDAIRAAALGQIDSVQLTTRKPSSSLPTTKPRPAHTERSGARVIFRGDALRAVEQFPANANVAAALALAGVGGERTKVEIIGDPLIDHNIHEIEVQSDVVRLSIRVEGIPDPTNPRTSRLAARSIVAALISLVSEVRVGS